MAKGYQKKKRASKYEKKLAINASFEDVIKIALGMEPEQKIHVMAQPIKLKFPNETESDNVFQIESTLSHNMIMHIKFKEKLHSLFPIHIKLEDTKTKDIKLKDGELPKSSDTMAAKVIPFKPGFQEGDIDCSLIGTTILCDTISFFSKAESMEAEVIISAVAGR